ncbi:hypothetical protein GCM10020000_48600 [Streptomyces olivoverticillatus]
MTMLAAWLPGRRAAKIPPVAAMNSVHAVATTRSLVVRNTIGALLSGTGIAAVLAATGMKDGKTVLGIGAGLLLIGVFVLTPLLSRPLIAAAAPVLNLFGISGKLARQNAVRNPRRTAATASALMIGLTLITGLTVIAGSVQQAIDKMATSAIKADYVVSMASHTPLSPEVAKKLASAPGVTASSPLRMSASRIDGDHESLTGVDGKSIKELTKLDFTVSSFDGLTCRQGGRRREHRQVPRLEARLDGRCHLRGRQARQDHRLGHLQGQRADARHHGRHHDPRPAPERGQRPAGHGQDKGGHGRVGQGLPEQGPR